MRAAFARAITRRIRGWLKALGKQVARRPAVVILAATLTCLVLAAGAAVQLRWEGDSAKLWCVVTPGFVVVCLAACCP